MIRGLEDVTHIVTLVDENRLCRRTEKYLHGIIAGKWIVDKSCVYVIRWSIHQSFIYVL